MTPIAWMAGAGVVSWLALGAIAGSRAHPEALLGMLGPLVSVCATWFFVRRTHASAPERLTGVMVMGLALKAAFFGVYFVVMLRVLAMRPVPFVLSFTGYFIALYVMEALFLRRLLTNAPR